MSLAGVGEALDVGERLAPCTRIWGADTYVVTDPATEVVHRAVYNPFDPALWLSDPNWGLYRENGRLVEAAGYYRLPVRFRVGQSELVELPAEVEEAPAGQYVYAGPVIMHFGHFITAFLPRLWQLVRGGIGADVVFVCHSDLQPSDWFARDYVRTMLGALGLGPERFVVPGRSTRFRRIVVPQAAFGEQSFAHRAMRDLCLRIGAGAGIVAGAPGPVYLSKTLVRNGTYRIGNEAAMDDAMAERGVRVVRPETLSFRDQLGVLAGASAIVGTIGSGFHSSIFVDKPCRMVGLAYGDTVNSNYRLIDKLTGASATYVHAGDAMRPKALAGVTFGYWLDDPHAIACDLLRLL